jgi:hypothetical protein
MRIPVRLMSEYIQSHLHCRLVTPLSRDNLNTIASLAYDERLDHPLLGDRRLSSERSPITWRG